MAGPSEIVVDVEHTALNRADILQRMGMYPDPRQRDIEVPGMEYAGTVHSIGEDVTEWSVGDRVMGIEAGGCYAERVVTHARQAMPIPSSVATADAAAIPEVFLTAWDALVVQGGLTSGAGRSSTPARPVSVRRRSRSPRRSGHGLRSPARRARPTSVANSVPISSSNGARPIGSPSCRRPSRAGSTSILDVIGGDEVDRNLRAVRPDGTIVQVGLMGGGSTEVNVGLILAEADHLDRHHAAVTPAGTQGRVSQRFIDEMLPLFDLGVLRPIVDSRFPLDEIAAGHARMESNANVGKILIDV